MYTQRISHSFQCTNNKWNNFDVDTALRLDFSQLKGVYHNKCISTSWQIFQSQLMNTLNQISRRLQRRSGVAPRLSSSGLQSNSQSRTALQSLDAWQTAGGDVTSFFPLFLFIEKNNSKRKLEIHLSRAQSFILLSSLLLPILPEPVVICQYQSHRSEPTADRLQGFVWRGKFSNRRISNLI